MTRNTTPTTPKIKENEPELSQYIFGKTAAFLYICWEVPSVIPKTEDSPHPQNIAS